MFIKLCISLLSHLSTFRAMTRSVGLCKTFITTPPFPAPSSPILSKTSAVNSPTFCFCVKKASNLSLCWSSMSSSFNFCVSDSMFGFGFLKKWWHLQTRSVLIRVQWSIVYSVIWRTRIQLHVTLAIKTVKTWKKNLF